MTQESGIALSAVQNNASVKGSLSNRIELVQNKFSDYYSLRGGEKILKNADLNNYMTAGNYYCETNTDAATLLNCPTNKMAFTMKVMMATGFYYPAQYLRTYYDGKIYYRVFETAWQPWYCIKTEKVQS